MRLRSQAFVAGLWGFAEGTIFFVVPDVCVTCFALFSFKESAKALQSAVLGALIAGVLMYALASCDYQLARRIVLSVPFVSQPLLDQSRADYLQHAWLATVYAPLSGIPYKVFAIEAVQYIGILPFVFASILARFGRIGAAWGLAALIRVCFKRTIDMRPRLFLAIHFLFWSVFYSWYWSKFTF